MFSVTVEHSGETVILHARGSLVRGEETGLLCAAVRHHGRNVVLDLSRVKTMDAAGIGALISLQSAGIYLRLENPTGPVREILRVTGMESVFEICDPRSPVGALAEKSLENAAEAVAGRVK
jgi:anti-anti-sigma factor